MVAKVVVQLVEELTGVMTISDVCQHLGVARSTYYRRRKTADQINDKEIRDRKIGELCKENKFRYGYRMITTLYPGISEKKVQRVMQKNGWQCRVKMKKRKRTWTTSDYLTELTST